MDTEKPKATLLYRGRRIEARAGMTLRDAVRQAGLSPEGVLAAREGVLVTDDTILKAGEEIRLVAVISGG
jgi:sulfur carrier protein ThiS